jgi:hypothetical protein
MRYFCLTICLAAAAACGSDPVGPSPLAEGQYHLVSVDGASLPVRTTDSDLFGETLITSGTLTFHSSPGHTTDHVDWTWDDSVDVAYPNSTYVPSAVLYDWGQVSVSGPSISLLSMTTLETMRGKVNLTDVSITKDGQRWVYRR